MPVYAFGPQQDRRPTPGELATNFGNTLADVYGRHAQNKAQEAARATLENPNATPVQQALAWAALGQNQAASQTIKQSGVQQAQQRIAEQYADLNPQPIQPKLIEGASTQPPATEPAPTETAQIPAIGTQAPPISQVPQQVQGMPGNQAQGNVPQGTQGQSGLQTPQQKLQHAARLRQRGEAYNASGLPQLANADLNAATSLENQATAQKKLDIASQQFNQKQLLPIQTEAHKSITSTDKVIKALNDQLQVAQAGKVDPFSKANFSDILKDLGYEKLAAAAQSEGGAIFKTAGKEVITGGLKNAFGARPIGVEFEAFDAMLAQVGRTKEANELAIKSLLAAPTIENEVAKFKMQLISEDPNINPIELNSAAYQYEEAVRDGVYHDWKSSLNKALASSQRKGGFFGMGNTPAQPAPIPEGKSASLESIWGP